MVFLLGMLRNAAEVQVEKCSFFCWFNQIPHTRHELKMLLHQLYICWRIPHKIKYSTVKNDVSIRFWENWLFARCWFMMFGGAVKDLNAFYDLNRTNKQSSRMHVLSFWSKGHHTLTIYNSMLNRYLMMMQIVCSFWVLFTKFENWNGSNALR